MSHETLLRGAERENVWVNQLSRNLLNYDFKLLSSRSALSCAYYTIYIVSICIEGLRDQKRRRTNVVWLIAI